MENKISVKDKIVYINNKPFLQLNKDGYCKEEKDFIMFYEVKDIYFKEYRSFYYVDNFDCYHCVYRINLKNLVFERYCDDIEKFIVISPDYMYFTKEEFLKDVKNEKLVNFIFKIHPLEDVSELYSFYESESEVSMYCPEFLTINNITDEKMTNLLKYNPHKENDEGLLECFTKSNEGVECSFACGSFFDSKKIYVIKRTESLNEELDIWNSDELSEYIYCFQIGDSYFYLLKVIK